MREITRKPGCDRDRGIQRLLLPCPVVSKPAPKPASRMTRGNQRELAREKNIKKQKSQKGGTQLPEGTSLAQKKTLDADIMRQKQAKALAEKQQQQEKK